MKAQLKFQWKTEYTFKMKLTEACDDTADNKWKWHWNEKNAETNRKFNAENVAKRKVFWF